MNYKRLTFIVTALSIVGLLVYDGYVLLVDGTEASISHLIITSSYKFPIIPLFFGFLMGHFFWPMRQTDEMKRIADFIKGADK